VLIYDRDGTLRYKLTGDDPNRQFTNGDVDRAIQELLRSSGHASAGLKSIDMGQLNAYVHVLI
jgi:hypothetical protein